MRDDRLRHSERGTSRARPLRIGELAAEAGVNPKTIRYYEDVGLLPPPERSESGYRLYTRHDHERLGFIRRAKQIGFSLEEIRAILHVSESGVAPCEHVLTLLDRKIGTTAEQMHALAAYYRQLVELRSSARRLARGRMRSPTEREVCICGIIEHQEVVRADAPSRGHSTLQPTGSTSARRDVRS